MVIAMRDEHRLLESLCFLLERGQKRLEWLAIFRFSIERIAVQRDDNGRSVGRLRRAEGLADPRRCRLGSPPHRLVVNASTSRKAPHTIRAPDQMNSREDDFRDQLQRTFSTNSAWLARAILLPPKALRRRIEKNPSQPYEAFLGHEATRAGFPAIEPLVVTRCVDDGMSKSIELLASAAIHLVLHGRQKMSPMLMTEVRSCASRSWRISLNWRVFGQEYGASPITATEKRPPDWAWAHPAPA